MGRLVDWDEEIGGNKKKTSAKSGVLWMKIKNLYKHVLRPVGKPVMFWRYTNKRDGRFYSVIVDDEIDNLIYQNYDITPDMRFALNIFDREDGELKVYEFPPKVYSFLKQVKSISKTEPGGSEGSDISVFREVTGKKTNYELACLDASPFTEAEKIRIRAERDEDGNIVSGGIYQLKEIFKSTPEDKLEYYLYGKSAQEVPSGNESPVKESPVKESPVVKEPVASSDDIDKDLDF